MNGLNADACAFRQVMQWQSPIRKGSDRASKRIAPQAHPPASCIGPSSMTLQRQLRSFDPRQLVRRPDLQPQGRNVRESELFEGLLLAQCSCGLLVREWG